MNEPVPVEKSIFLHALEITSTEERSAYLDEACGADPGLRAGVEALLDAHAQPLGLLDGAALRPPLADLEALQATEPRGTTIGPYRLHEPIGHGGMGVVYRAEQTQPMHRWVALKIIKPGMDTRQVIARFEAERQALAMMDHPNIAKVLDAGTTETMRPYFVMELVRGIPITEYCDREKLTILERLDLFVTICRAVQHAHQKGIIHRDLKPSNVLVAEVDGAAVPKVIDFGVAKATGGRLTDRTLYTSFHQIIGTPMYMSPEQADLTGVDVDTRSDVYSLGVLLYEILTGTTPFDQETLRRVAFDEMRRMIREEEPPTPSARLSSLGSERSAVSARRKADVRHLDRTLRGELDWIVMKALEKDRRRRYDTAGDFASDVLRYTTDQPVEAGPPSTWYRLRKSARRNRVVLTTAALVAGALLVGLAASVAMTIRALEAERKTTAALERAREAVAEAGRQNAYARRAVDEMYTQVAQKWLGHDGRLTPLQREFFQKALAFYEEFAREKGADPKLRAEAAEAAARVGEIQNQLGLSAGALESHRRALAAFRLLAAEFPDRPEGRRRVARSLHDIGRLLESLGRTKEAEPAYLEALALREPLARAPGLPADRADLAVVLRSLGDLLAATGRADEGQQSGLRGIQLLTTLVDEFPAEPRYQGLLASAEMSLGLLDENLLSLPFRTYDTETRYRHALELRQKLAASDPTDPEYQIDLAMCHRSLGVYYGATLRRVPAIEHLRLALAIEEKLVADHPDRPGNRSYLTHTLDVLAEQLVRLGDFDAAERTLIRAGEVAEKLANDFPDVPDYRVEVAVASEQLGKVMAQRGRNREAREALERACAMRADLASKHPDLSLYRRKLAETCHAAAITYATLNGHEAKDAERARALSRQAVALDGDSTIFRRGLALAEYRAGDFNAALEAETKSLTMNGRASYAYDWLLMALIHEARGEREKAQRWALQLRSRGPGIWAFPEPDFVRLARETQAKVQTLIPADPEALRALFERTLEAQRRGRRPADPTVLERMDWLAGQLVILGREAEAAALYEESRRLAPGRVGTIGFTDPWCSLAVLALRKGDVDGYRTRCAAMLDKLRGEVGPEVAAKLSRLYTLIPDMPIDPQRPIELGRSSLAFDNPRPRYLVALGAAEFRAGRFEAALETLGRTELEVGQIVGVEVALFRAMTLHRLGRTEEARRALAEADRALAEVPDERGVSPVFSTWDWRAVTCCRILRREAGAMLGIKDNDKATETKR